MKVVADKSVKNFLVDFGLTDKEITLYLTLLKTGPNTIMNLARETAIKRSTTHNTVEELIKKGLISQTNYGERRMVVAEDPDKLKFLMEEKKWSLGRLDKNLSDVIKGIYGLVPAAKENSKSSVRYYDGIKGVRNIYEEAFAAKEIRSYVNLGLTGEKMEENSEMFKTLRAKVKDGMVLEIVDSSSESIAAAKEFTQSKEFKYKIAPKALKFQSIDVLIFNNKVATINLGETIKGIVVEDTDYFTHSSETFDYIWSTIA